MQNYGHGGVARGFLRQDAQLHSSIATDLAQLLESWQKHKDRKSDFVVK